MILEIVIFIFGLSILFGEANPFDGNYSLADLSACDKNIVIRVKNNFFTFYTTDSPLKYELLTQGRIRVLDYSPKIYIKMNEIEALYHEKTILIQNSGTAMNEYTYFDFCSAKYLKFNQIP